MIQRINKESDEIKNIYNNLHRWFFSIEQSRINFYTLAD